MPERHRPPSPSRGAALLCIALAASGGVGASSGVYTGRAGAPPRASVDFAVRIPQVLALTTLRSRETIEASDAGAVQVADAASFEIRSNLAGYGLRFEIRDPDVASVEVQGLGEAVVVPPAGRVVRFVTGRGERRLHRTLAYRVTYRAGTRPGRRHIPIAYSLIGE